MKLPNWKEQFQPLSLMGWGIREGQQNLGNAFTQAIENRTSLIGEAGTGTGKSFVALIPVIHAIKKSAEEMKTFRAVISTETITLQNQIVKKDIPMLEKFYGPLKYKKLMGRSNYLCLDSAHQEVVGDIGLNNLYMRLEGAGSRLTTGERDDVEKVLGITLENDQWAALTGSSDFCTDNKCSDSKRCFGAKARQEALAADIVVCNHSILATDVGMKRNSPALEEIGGILGTIDVLIVDEGHRLVPVFASHFTETVTGYEIYQMGIDISNGADEIKKVANVPLAEVVEAVDDVKKLIDLSVQYYSYGVEEWKKSEDRFIFRTFRSATPDFMPIMEEFEGTAVNRLTHVIGVLEKHKKITENALRDIAKPSKWAASRKGLRKTVKLIEICAILRDSLLSQEGIVNHYGMFGVVVNGWYRNDGTKGISILLEPLDVSPQIKTLWGQCDTALLMSATLTDPTHQDPYRFIKVSTGFPSEQVIKVESPFDSQTQQLVYVTAAQAPPMPGARFSFDELLYLLLLSQGRSLVLFTSRSELDEAALKLRLMQSENKFPYRILVQEADSDKQKLAKEFKEDTHSVLLGTDSFMTGFDAPGETLTQVILCKFTMPKYNAQMKQKISYWRSRGFPEYYSRAALEKFIQAAGRLIRSDECRGVFSLLDQAVLDKSSNVFKTASKGVNQLGSPITQDVNEVKGFLDGILV